MGFLRKTWLLRASLVLLVWLAIMLPCLKLAKVHTGTAWVTVFGRDFGFETDDGDLWLSTAPGGFHFWFAGQKYREMGTKMFDFGYLRDNMHLERQRQFPKARQRRIVPVSYVSFPFKFSWPIVLALLGWSFTCWWRVRTR